MKKPDVLRLSVTDRCNFRCIYCMPEQGVELLPADDLLTYEEIEIIVQAAFELGIRRFRLTGGEPLVRRGLVFLIEKISNLNPDDIALTTNGWLLEKYARDLHRAGLKRVTVSLDTLNSKKFKCITRHDGFEKVLTGIKEARRAGLEPLKINTVIMAGVNDNEITDFVRFSLDEGIEVRFIELMPTIALASGCKESSVWQPLPVKSQTIKEKIERFFGALEPVDSSEGGVAEVFLLNGRARLGFISPVSRPFCQGCRRLRLSSDGRLRICLFDRIGLDLRSIIRQPVERPAAIKSAFEKALSQKILWTRPEQIQLRAEMSKVGG